MRSTLKTLAILAAGCIVLSATGCKPSTEKAPNRGAWIVAPEGAPRVYVPLRPTGDELLAANELARVLAEMSGRPVYIRREPFLFRGDGYYLGDTQTARELLTDIVARAPASGGDEKAPMPAERWDNVGWSAKDGRIAIAGSSPLATRFAVSRFVQENCGVRWWFPGEDGEDIPKIARREIPQGEKVEKPSYVSRYLLTRRTPDEKAWQIRNCLVEHVQGNHSLHNLFDKSLAREHPDWFPTFDGKPYNPDVRKGPCPHPNFLNKEAAKYVAGNAIAYFNAHPQAIGYSISPADNTLFGDLDAYRGILRENAAFRGKADLSNAVFAFDNTVAGIVAKKYPDRYLGALAYAFYENVPDFLVAPNLMPVLTADRSQWYDPAFRAEDLALVAKWSKAGPKLVATWDYYYGYPFIVPRVMLGEVEDSIPALRKAGVSVFFAEMNPIWGFDAPKAWIASQLLWDCGQNPVGLENEFFTGCYGPAADDMREFFLQCDSIWMAQPGKARWIRYYGDFDQTAIYTAGDFAELRTLLDRALTKDLPGKYRARVELVANAFDTAERLMADRAAAMRVSRWTPGMSADELEEAIPPYLASRKDAARIFDQALPLNDPLESPGYTTDDDPLAGRLALGAKTFTADEKARLRAAAPDYAAIVDGGTSFILNEPFKDGLKNWLVTHWPNPLLDYSLTGSGPDATLSVAKANTFCLMLKARVKPGTVYGMAFAAEGRVSASSAVQLLLEYLDKDGNVLAYSADSLPYGDLANMPLAVAAKAPRFVALARVTLIVKYQAADDVVRLSAWRPLLHK